MSDELKALTEQFGKFQLQVVGSMGEVKGEIGKLGIQVKDLVDQVKHQNGNVARLNERMGVVETHPFNCVMRDKVSDLENKITSGKHPGSTEIWAKVGEVENLAVSHIREFEKNETVAEHWKTGVLIPVVKWLAISSITIGILLAGMHFSELLGG